MKIILIYIYLMNKLPQLGANITLDFLKPLISVNKPDEISKAIVDGLKSKFSETSVNTNEIKFGELITQFFSFSNGYITVTPHPSIDMLTVDVRIVTNKNERTVSNYEEFLCETFGWTSNTGNVSYSRGETDYHQLNKYYHSETLYKNFKLIHREQTKFQDLRIYDTREMGRVLSLDYMIQNSDQLEDDSYTIDLCSLALEKGKSYNHILLIGAGDLIIPDYILKNFDVKKITLVEIDDRVIENTKKYFKFFNDSVEAFVKDGRLEIIVDDGAKYIKERQGEGELFDGVIIDNSDVYLFEGPAANLFTKEFYSNIKTCLKKGAFFCQQISEEEVKAKWTEIVKSVGFETIKYKYSQTPEYSTALPMGAAQKS
jgi:spermidine synthase